IRDKLVTGVQTCALPILDAIETFGNVLYEIRDVPFGFDYDLSRIIWDEVRHTELGHKAMEALGYDPYDLLNRLLGIKVRTKMPRSEERRVGKEWRAGRWW